MRDHPFLGIDPGLLETGWALAVGRKVLDSGSVKMPKSNLDSVEAMEFAVYAAVDEALDRCSFRAKPALAIERYAYQGPEKAKNPDGPKVAELAGSLATGFRYQGFVVLRITRNEALRCFSGGKMGRKIPSEATANASLQLLFGVRLSNQHKRDALMQCVAAQRRCR